MNAKMNSTSTSRGGTPGARSIDPPRPRRWLSWIVPVALFAGALWFITAATPHRTPEILRAQKQYLRDVLPVYPALARFDQGSPPHTLAAAKELVGALQQQNHNLAQQRWPAVVVPEISELVASSELEMTLVERYEIAPASQRPGILTQRQGLFPAIRGEAATIRAALDLPPAPRA